MANKEDDFQHIKVLHRKAHMPLVRQALTTADPDLQEFAAGLPAELDSVEAHLKNFWARKGWNEDQVQDFARRYGGALADSPDFRAFEQVMENLARAAGTPEFAASLAAAARQLGLDPRQIL